MRQYRGQVLFCGHCFHPLFFPLFQSFSSAIRLLCRLYASSAALSRSVKRSASAVALVMHQGSYGCRTAKCQGLLYRKTAQRLDRSALSRCISRASVALTQVASWLCSLFCFLHRLSSSFSSSYPRLQGAPCQHTHTQTTASLMQPRSCWHRLPIQDQYICFCLRLAGLLSIKSIVPLQELAVPS